MALRFFTSAALLSAAALSGFGQQAPDDAPVASAHVAGPHGLEGWTLNSPLPDDSTHERYPFTLVIARNGRALRKIPGSAFVWHWIFWNDGRQVAYESGPLHFGMSCNLYDLASGRDVESVDCWRGIPDKSPAWLVALEKPH
jgi:hypothetical protein